MDVDHQGCPPTLSGPEHAAAAIYIPPEILLAILAPIAPQRVMPPVIISFLKETEIQREIEYASERRNFANLALVSPLFKGAVYHHLFRNLVILPSTDIVKLAAVLENYGSLVRTIIFDGISSDLPYLLQPQCPDNIANRITEMHRAVNRCFALANHAKELEVYGHHVLFIPEIARSTWHRNCRIPEFSIPGDPLPVIQSLTWRCLPHRSDLDFRHALHRLGPNLEVLRVEMWKDLSVGATPNMTLPISKLPKLRCLQIGYGQATFEDVNELVQSTMFTNDAGHTFTNLRQLVIMEVEMIGEEQFLTLLRSNSLGSRLEHLSIFLAPTVRQNHTHIQRTFSPSLPSSILQLCPSLRQFAYLNVATTDFSSDLPPSLASLRFTFQPDALTNNTRMSALADYISSPNGANLRDLTIVLMGPIDVGIQVSLEGVCARNRVRCDIREEKFPRFSNS
ncbi:hypothetical protein JAAARDRAFT_59806 [Jaapia argillacea MUCL 33604]|uniref:F-box domain-containing protein n=1 Tax=Jaapia argillacea MUCL 33604 TaxID=933084 RepID=A0A067PX29_9AGAM|nr:hypothetical protein JAAARDRAFT_59806 [Jaapia argillacea MUCL 33604]